MVPLVILIDTNPQLFGLWIGYNQLRDLKIAEKVLKRSRLEVVSVTGNLELKGIRGLKKAMKGRLLFL